MLSMILLLLILISLAYSVISGDIASLSGAVLSAAEDAVSLCLTLAGSMALWGGIMNTAEKCGITAVIGRLLSRPLRLMFPDADEDTSRLISLNVTSNLLGLGNAATPAGIRAMCAMERGHIGEKQAAIFLLLNTASIQLIPMTVASMRQAAGSVSPWDITLPTLMTSVCALVCGLVTANIIYMKE